MARKRVEKFKRSRRLVVAASLMLVAAALAYTFRYTSTGEQIAAFFASLTEDDESICCESHQVLATHNAPLIAYVVRDIWRDGTPGRYALPERMSTPAQAVYVGVGTNGSISAETWTEEGTVLEAMAAGINRTRGQTPLSRRAAIDTIEIFLGHSFRRIRSDDYETEIFANHHRGIRALEIRYDDKVARYSPMKVLRENTSMRRLVDQFAAENGFNAEDVLEDGRFRIFDGEQLLIKLGRRPTGTLMERGNEYVRVEAITAKDVRHAVDLATDWLVHNTDIQGRTTYGYRPSARESLDGNNLIRQWMATNALGQAARIQYGFTVFDVAERNLKFNLREYFHREEDLGVVYLEADEVKLGAVALAALAIAEHHNPRPYAEQERLLRATVDALWQPDGSFKTFLRPSRRQGANQNFYPGEALLYWATLYTSDPDPERLARFMASFRYYRDWHLDPARRNPAFVGWHTQANYRMWQQTQDPELRDFIFEMNDWLIGLQQWDLPYEYRDMMGRFYAPSRPDFGPPHASSTAVYMEGLVDAFALARETGDAERAERYRISILRGLRDLIQLQFQDDIDMFYVPEGFRDHVRGGLRTTAYNNVIRVDNVQHTLMAMTKVLKTFKPDDYNYAADDS